MFKKIDKTIEYERYTEGINNQIIFNYKPSIDISYRITNAILKVKLKSYYSYGILDVRCDGKTIDQISQLRDDLYINITEELISALSKNQSQITIRGVFNNTLANLKVQECCVLIDYIPSNLSVENNAYKEFDAKRAGSGRINLFTGNMTLVHKDAHLKSNGLSLDISHIYNKYLSDNPDEYGKLIKGFGNGWKLNAQQFLIKENLEELDGDNSLKVFKHIDDNGEVHIFKEQYYYLDNNKKIYITPAEVTIDKNEELVYRTIENENEKIYKVEKNILSSSGAVLTSKLEDYKGIENIQTNIDEIESINEQINTLYLANSQYSKSLEQSQKSKEILDRAKELEDLQYETQRESLELEKTDNEYTQELTAKQVQFKQAQQEQQDMQIELQDLQLDLQANQNIAQEKQLEVQLKQSELQSMQAELQSMQFTFNAEQLKMQEEQENVQTVQLEVQRKQLDVQAKQLEVQDLQIKLQDQQVEVQNKQISVETAQISFENAQKDVQNKQISSQVKQSEYQSLQVNLQNKQIELATEEKSYNDSCDKIQKQFESYDLSNEEAKKRYAGTDTYIKKRDASFKKIQDYKTDLIDLENTLVSKENELKRAQDDLVASERLMVSSQTNLITAQTNLKSAEDTLKSCQINLQIKQKVLLPLQNELQAKQIALLNLQEELDLNRVDLLERQNEMQRKQTEIQASQAELIELQCSFNDLQTSLHESQEVISARQVELQNKQRQINELQAELNQFEFEHVENSSRIKERILANNQVLLEGNIETSTLQHEHQTQQIANEISILTENINHNNLKIQKLQHKLHLLNLQVPVHFITDSNGTAFGFAETGNEDEKGKVYRLILAIDKWENTINIKYNDNNQIDQIEGGQSVVSFKYNKRTGNLNRLIDEKGHKIEFKYSSDCLTEIVYFDGSKSTYTYDSYNNLTQLLSVDGIGVQFGYENSRIISVDTVSNSSRIEHNHIIKNSKITKETGCIIKYNDARSTSIIDEAGIETVYIFDISGRPITVYEKKGDYENIVAKSFDFSNGEVYYSVTPLNLGENYLKDSCYKASNNKNICEHFDESESYFGNNFSGDNILDDYSIVLSKYRVEDPNVKMITNGYIYRDVSSKAIAEIQKSNKKDFVLSAWAKADSACVVRRCTKYSNYDDDNISFNEFDKEYSDRVVGIQKSRRFELRAEITYKNKRVETFYASFDWKQQDWQYCVLPIVLSENKNYVLESIRVYFDYSDNTNTAYLKNMSLKEGIWEYAEYNSDKQKTYEESSESNYVTQYEYDEDKRLISTIMTKSDGTEYLTKYEYNSHNVPVRMIDYNGIAKENIYNEKGVIVNTITYNIDDPSSRIYNEYVFDDNGNESGAVNEFGEKIYDYTTLQNTGKVTVATDRDGNQIAYGYDNFEDKQISISASVDGQQNSNTSIYTADLLTKLSHNGFDIDYSYDGFGRQTDINIAGHKYAQANYVKDLNKQEITTTYKVYKSDNEVDTIEAVTDLQGNEIEKKYNGDTIVRNLYDVCGRLAKTYDISNDVQCVVDYDEKDNELKREYVGLGKTFTISNEYNKNNETMSMAIKLGDISRSTEYLYQDKPNGKIMSASLPNGVRQVPIYDRLGRFGRIEQTLGNLSFGKDIYYKQIGDHTSGLIASEWFEKNGIRKDRIAYSYDEKGNIIAIKENEFLIARYEYDSLSRLIREDNRKLNKTILFAYDNGGNIVRRTEHPYTLNTTMNLENCNTYAYEYASTGWRDQLHSYNGAVCGDYDNLGNPNVYRGKQLSWSHGRQLDCIGNVQFKYDAHGVRISKIVDNKETKFYADSNTLVAQESENDSILFTQGIDGLNGFMLNGVEYFYKKNILGDILAILDDTGAEIVRYVYDAWGNHNTLVIENGQFVETPLTELGQNYLNIAVLNPYRYRSYYYDIETSLYYLNSRYYDPEVGRFINADDISELDDSKLNGLNLYTYCINKPVMYIDPNGNSFIAILFSLLIAGIIGAAVGAVCYTISVAVSAAKTGEWNWSWKEFGLNVLGGFVGGVISAIPIGGAFGAFIFGGIGAVANGLITGSVDSLETGMLTFLLGAFANALAYNISDFIAGAKAQKVFNLGNKSKSLAVQKLQGHRSNGGSAFLKGSMRNAFKNVSVGYIKKLIFNADFFLRNGIYSAIISSFLTSLNIA